MTEEIQIRITRPEEAPAILAIAEALELVNEKYPVK